jgi:hypothetical protein
MAPRERLKPTCCRRRGAPAPKIALPTRGSGRRRERPSHRACLVANARKTTPTERPAAHRCCRQRKPMMAGPPVSAAGGGVFDRFSPSPRQAAAAGRQAVATPGGAEGPAQAWKKARGAAARPSLRRPAVDRRTDRRAPHVVPWQHSQRGLKEWAIGGCGGQHGGRDRARYVVPLGGTARVHSNSSGVGSRGRPGGAPDRASAARTFTRSAALSAAVAQSGCSWRMRPAS